VTKDDDVLKLNFIKIYFIKRTIAMSNPTQTEQQMSLSDAEQMVDLYDSLIRLRASKDFQLVFEKHLFKDEVIRLHALSAHPEMEKVEQAQRIENDLKAIANIKFQLQMMEVIGSNMKAELDAYRAEELSVDSDIEV
jgi:hypothetical protein